MRRLTAIILGIAILAILSLLLMSHLHEGESATRIAIVESPLNREESLKAIKSLHATVMQIKGVSMQIKGVRTL